MASLTEEVSWMRDETFFPLKTRQDEFHIIMFLWIWTWQNKLWVWSALFWNHVLAACAFKAFERAVCNFTLSQGLVGRWTGGRCYSHGTTLWLQQFFDGIISLTWEQQEDHSTSDHDWELKDREDVVINIICSRSRKQQHQSRLRLQNIITQSFTETKPGVWIFT